RAMLVTTLLPQFRHMPSSDDHALPPAEDSEEDALLPHLSVAEIIVAEGQANCRLDWFLAQQFSTYSRTHLRKVINAAAIKVNGLRAKAAHRLHVGDRILVELPELPHEGPQPENIPLKILYEDDSLAVIDKPP